MKISVVIIAIFLLVVAFLVIMIRRFEINSVYFPDRSPGPDPSSAGLRFDDIYLRTSDDVRIHAWLIPHAGMSRGVILFCHGNAGNMTGRIDIISILARTGFDVMIFDYRSYGKSGGRISEEGTYRDAVAAFDYIVSRDETIADKIVVYGKSLGGAVAVELAKRRSVRALVCDSTFTSVEDMAGEVYPLLPINLFLTIKYDNMAKIGGISVPKLILHSRGDEIIPYNHGVRIFEAASEPKEMFPVSGRHNEWVFEYEEGLLRGLDVFFAEKCGL